MSKGTRAINLTDDRKANWKAFGKSRADRALDAIRVLANCGNRANYEPNEEDIRKIELALLEAVRGTVAVLRSGQREARTGIDI